MCRYFRHVIYPADNNGVYALRTTFSAMSQPVYGARGSPPLHSAQVRERIDLPW
jgi:hypothetical protein